MQIDEIPWHRITTTYARATDFPKYFDVLWQMSDMKEVDKAGREIEINIEHQSTLWHVTPFAMIFLVRIFKKAVEKMENSSKAGGPDYLLQFMDPRVICAVDRKSVV